jgi:uncharacterized protein YdeI (YjbR/CyaY-like superfamily)
VTPPDSEVLDMPDAAAWHAWLDVHHAARTDAWLRIAKRRSGRLSVTTDDALDVALCFGWIDGQRRSLDESSFLQRYCPRRPKSTWSEVNVAKVAALTAAGRMQPPGLAEVAAAHADGRWEAAYASQRSAQVPPELMSALLADAGAAAVFERLGRSERYTLILPLMKARTPAGRMRALQRVLERLAGSASPG